MYSRFQIFRHDIVKKYKSRASKRKWRGPIRFLCEYESSGNQFGGNQSHTKFLWTYSSHKSIYSVVFSYIVPKYLKPTLLLPMYYLLLFTIHTVFPLIRPPPLVELPSNKAPLSGNVERNLTTEMNVSDYLQLLIFLKAPSTRPLKNRATGGSIRGNTVYSSAYSNYIY